MGKGIIAFGDIKTQKLKLATLLKKKLWHSSFPVNFVKYLRAPFLTEHLGACF